MELSVSATDRTAWVAMTPAVRLCQPRLLQSGAGEGELLPSPATPSPKSTQPNRRGHNFENRTFHLLQKPDILTCYRHARFVGRARALCGGRLPIGEIAIAFVLDTISLATLGYVAAAALNINRMLIDSPRLSRTDKLQIRSHDVYATEFYSRAVDDG